VTERPRCAKETDSAVGACCILGRHKWGKPHRLESSQGDGGRTSGRADCQQAVFLADLSASGLSAGLWAAEPC